MSKEPGFSSSLKTLWFQLTSLSIVGLTFAVGLVLAQGKIQGWSFYLAGGEVIYEVVVRFIASALAGIALGTICAGIAAPFLWYFESARERIVQWITRLGVLVVLFWDSRISVEPLVQWFGHGIRFIPALLIAHIVVFVAALCIPRLREEVITSLDLFLGRRTTRGIALATVLTAGLLIGLQFVLGSATPTVKAAAQLQPRPNRNVLLITFDALDAEDMSLYGRKLRTTPNIDAFASRATVFTNFYSASTFTTPSIATMETGRYPSEDHVYHLQGRVSPELVGKSLPEVMKAAGYTNAAFLSNPFAYYLTKGLAAGYDALPEPTFEQGGLSHLWSATQLLHQNSGFGCRLDEYMDLGIVWNSLDRLPHNTEMRFRPDASFDQARALLAKLPDGYFLWVHVITPHNPYLPDADERGRFLPADQVRTFEEESGGRWKPHYEPDQQPLVDERRLRYDEFIATADRAFGAFMSEVEKDGRLRNTTVVISADHGESFEGGVYQHSSPYLTRPVIHVPLIIRTPDQQQARKVAMVADQTSLAPTILELVGLSKPDTMSGASLVKWLNNAESGEGQGLAFSQYLERNSVFRPLRHGTVGVIDGRYQYVVDLESQKGALRPMSEAHFWNLDRTSEHPAEAAKLRAAIHQRFPELVQ